ncbi:MAG: hypothetical protein LUH10_16115 [Tannerellaceae bacterium]|nr:hypothetical protein [Tannerellaceae bacterium]
MFTTLSDDADDAIIVHLLSPFISVSCTSSEKEKIIQDLGFEKVIYEGETYFEKTINRDDSEELKKEILLWLKEFIRLDAYLSIGNQPGTPFFGILILERFCIMIFAEEKQTKLELYASPWLYNYRWKPTPLLANYGARGIYPFLVKESRRNRLPGCRKRGY